MDPMLLLASVLAMFTVLALILAIGSFFNNDRRLDARMDLYLGSGLDPDEIPTHSSDREEGALADRINDAINKVGFAEGVRRNLARADVPLTVAEYMLLKLAAALLPMVIVLVLSRSLLAILPLGLLGFMAPSFWLRQRQVKRQRLFEEQLPEMLMTVISSLRGGFSLVQSLDNVAKEAPNPMGSEIRRVLQEVQLGLSVGDALSNLSKRMANEDTELLVTVLRIHARIGGNLTTVLENISTTIRERGRLQREIRVITSQQRYASYVLGLLPVILALILMTINPAYMMKLFAPGPILLIPIGAVILNLAGFLLIQKVVDIKV
ncbi:MAG: type II secretion system F family protein [Oscillochloridaceae bacterium umkhey_bin13]